MHREKSGAGKERLMRYPRSWSYTGDRVELVCANCHQHLLRPATEATTRPFICSDMCRSAYGDGRVAILRGGAGRPPARKLVSGYRTIPRKDRITATLG